MRVEDGRIIIEPVDLERGLEWIRAATRSLTLTISNESTADLPAWLVVVHRKLEEQIFSKIKGLLPPEAIEDPYSLGFAYGLLRWFLEFIATEFERLDRQLKHLPIDCECTESQLDNYWGSLITIILGADTDIPATFKQALRELRKAYMQWPIGKASVFYRGLADGLSGPNGEGGLYGRARENAHILITLWQNWKFVNELKTVSELHAWLCRYMGRARVGEYKRVEGICRSIGLKYGSPGRPSTKPKRLKSNRKRADRTRKSERRDRASRY